MDPRHRTGVDPLAVLLLKNRLRLPIGYKLLPAFRGQLPPIFFHCPLYGETTCLSIFQTINFLCLGFRKDLTNPIAGHEVNKRMLIGDTQTIPSFIWESGDIYSRFSRSRQLGGRIQSSAGGPTKV